MHITRRSFIQAICIIPGMGSITGHLRLERPTSGSQYWPAGPVQYFALGFRVSKEAMEDMLYTDVGDISQQLRNQARSQLLTRGYEIGSSEFETYVDFDTSDSVFYYRGQTKPRPGVRAWLNRLYDRWSSREEV